MTNILVIDDIRAFRDRRPARYIRTSQEALDFFETAPDQFATFDEVWLDHDLGEKTGRIDDIMRVVDFFCERAFNDNPVNVGVFVIHTSNPVGRAQMKTSLEHFGYRTRFAQADVDFYAALPVE